jgi:ParB-like chromosome segregation protein Spo0J
MSGLIRIPGGIASNFDTGSGATIVDLIRLADIAPLKLVTEEVKRSAKYRQIAASIAEIGLVEPPVVARSRENNGKFLLLDGHLRLEVSRDRGLIEIECLVSTEDEAFTYNKRVNRIAIIQEHRMILKAVENGVSEARIAKALNVDVASIRRRRKLLDGICSEAVELLKEKHLALNTSRSYANSARSGRSRRPG